MAWLISFGVFFVVMQLWSFATPIDGAPDERVQAVKAAAVVRGEWLGRQAQGMVAAETVVHAPGILVMPKVRACFIGRPEKSANCPRNPSSEAGMVRAVTYVGHYPPLYYLLVGLPSYLPSSRTWFWMRSLSSTWNAAMLGLALATALRWGRSRLLVPGILLAATPTTIFLSSVINPSGLEVTAAIVMWTAAIVLVTEHPSRPPPGLVAVLAGSVTVLVAVRSLSLLWPALCFAILLPLAWRRVEWRQAFGRRDVRSWSVLVLASAVAAMIWLVAAKGLTIVPLGRMPAGTPTSKLLREVLGQSPVLLRQAIGVFGWLDTPIAPVAELLWLSGASLLVLLGLAGASKRALASLVAAMVLSAIVPFALAMATVRNDGLIEQGRYFLPLAVGVPILAGALGPRAGLDPSLRRRLGLVAVGVVVVAQAIGAVWALHRYLVGRNGPLLPTATGRDVWRPPLPGVVLDLLFVAAWGSAGIALGAWVRRDPH